MRTWTARAWAVLLVVAITGLLAPPAHADPVRLDPAEVEDFLDSRVPELMKEQGVPGAAVTVVADGEEVVSRGYGEADPESGTPVSPAETSFPTGSVAKSFTAVAVLQLAERGDVDLHADVNTYLPEEAHIPRTPSGEPVTLHHLLTHTPGFEDAMAGAVSADPDGHTSLQDHIARDRPDLIYPPGRFTSYSNYGIAVAGAVVERVSGRPFIDYARENIFGPLGMERSAFAQKEADLPAHFATASRSMLTPGGGRAPGPEIGSNDFPAGYAFATAPDMGRFMLALLGEGAYGGERILAPETVEEMLGRRAEVHPLISAMGYGVYERFTGEPRVVGHHGDFLGANMEYAVVPEAGVGIVVAANGDADADFQDALWTVVIDAFLAEFTGAEQDTLPDGAGQGGGAGEGERPLSDYAGDYHAARVDRSGPTMLPTVLGSLRPASVDGDGLRMSCSAAPEEQHWTRIGDGLFRSADGEETAAFIEDGGEVVGLVCDSYPMHPYVKVAWHQTPAPWLAAAGAALLVLLSMLVWPAAALVRRVSVRGAGERGADDGRERTPRAARAARWTAGAAGLVLAAALGTVVALMGTEAAQMAFFTGSPVLEIPLAVAALPVAAVLALTVAAWRRRWWSVPVRAHYTAVGAAFAVFLSVAWHFNFVWTPWS
ncbi:serine hydrolase [Nocardiopsis sp. RSe5-2]|uniref:Serine hydrolase n=1 Tax=Nocardiopsis endophytica TaxID=3018445 RepID=A0ABT4UE65_9ACTN|nr:serine hydrolase domain-containing protein [Nocardiopsis endophytica]MDA2815233.1 serine hydrolase [Nocardiopsis endophytica]